VKYTPPLRALAQEHLVIGLKPKIFLPRAEARGYCVFSLQKLRNKVFLRNISYLMKDVYASEK
jgi:hypothetical protein